MRKQIMLLCLMLFSTAMYAQQSVRGTVTGAGNAPLPGASVTKKGTNTGTMTDNNGRFELNAAIGDLLTVSSVGYTSREVRVTSADMSIALQQGTGRMDEVVVVGYGTQRRANVSGSVAQLKGEKLLEAPAMNVTNMLAGRMAGVTTLQQSGRPGFDDATLRIRGLSTTSGNSAPVIVVDGVQRDFANLDPNEIESISLLKDAASAATYGVQGASGVILVTTKKGANRKPTISYSGEYTVAEFTRFPKFLNGPDYIKYYSRGEQLDNEYRSHYRADTVTATFTQQEYNDLLNGTNTNPFMGNTDWVGKLLNKTSPSQHHVLSLNGGADAVRYFVNLGYLKQDGVVRNNDFERYNVRTNLLANVNKYISLELNLGARKETRKSTGIPADDAVWMNPFYQAVRMNPTLPLYAPDGRPTATASGAGNVNPLAVIDNSGYQNYTTSVLNSTLTFGVKVPHVQGLELKLLTAYDKSYQLGKTWLQPYNLAVRSSSTNGWVWNNAQSAGITTTTLTQSTSDVTRQTLQPSINYESKFGVHGLKLLALYEYAQTDTKGFSSGARNFALTDIQEINYGSKATTDFVLPTGSSAQTKRAGYVGRLNYDYDGRYLVELVGRYDGSMNFLGSSKRWGFFPAASVGWVVSREKFMEKYDWLSLLKLRGSFGIAGNDRIGVLFPYMQAFSLTTTPSVVIGGNPVNSLYTTLVPNPDLTWETSRVTNVGFDATIGQGILDVQFDWFYKVTKDILNSQSSSYPLSTGGYYPSLVNYGIVDNRGFDLQLSHSNSFRKLNYTLTANAGWAHNRIIRYTEAANTPAAQRLVGKSIGTKFGYQAAGLYQSWDDVNNWPSPTATPAPGFIKYVDQNGDGKITSDDNVKIGGSNIPELSYGFNVNMRYGFVDFSALLQGAAISDVALGGNYEGSGGTSGVADNSPFTRAFYNFGNSPYFLMENSWTPENPNATFPRLSAYRSGAPNHNGYPNSFFIRDGSYLRLKSIQLGFTMPNNILEKVHVKTFRVYVAGFNLVTWDKLKYLDPEMPNVTNGFYPQQKMYTLGVNLSF